MVPGFSLLDLTLINARGKDFYYEILMSKSPQCENGFTRIANELLEAILLRRIPGQELRIVLAVIRKTYGFKKKSDQISYGQVAKATGIPRTRVIMHIKSLVSKKVLGSLNHGTRQPSTIWINKDYSQWIDSPIKETSPKEGTRVVSKKGLEPSPMIGVPQKKDKRNSTKEKTYCAKFLIFWNAYPKKKSKPVAEKAFLKLNPDKELRELILIKIKEAEKTDDWLKEKGQYIPYPATWLNARGWEDELKDTSSNKWDEVREKYGN